MSSSSLTPMSDSSSSSSPTPTLPIKLVFTREFIIQPELKATDRSYIVYDDGLTHHQKEITLEPKRETENTLIMTAMNTPQMKGDQFQEIQRRLNIVFDSFITDISKQQ
jgi:hypothetical protein